ncbi:MAG: hypothetical protein J6Q78_03785 [Clostridia bacterium]|nr:hypothetical protein [Clostridia bacterium]
MAKFNYFDTIEALSDLMELTVREVFEEKKNPAHIRNREITDSTNKMICELESKLFSDFFPPLERADIAAFAHSLGRVTSAAASIERRYRFSTSDAEICVKLAELINQNAHMLKKIRKADGIPNRDSFRALAKKADEQKSRGIAYSKATENRSAIEELIRELSSCFDRLVEIMLNNI